MKTKATQDDSRKVSKTFGELLVNLCFPSKPMFNWVPDKEPAASGVEVKEGERCVVEIDYGEDHVLIDAW